MRRGELPGSQRGDDGNLTRQHQRSADFCERIRMSLAGQVRSFNRFYTRRGNHDGLSRNASMVIHNWLGVYDGAQKSAVEASG